MTIIPIKLSVQHFNGRRRQVVVEVEKTPADDDRSLMDKASVVFRRRFGCMERIIAWHISHERRAAR